MGMNAYSWYFWLLGSNMGTNLNLIKWVPRKLLICKLLNCKYLMLNVVIFFLLLRDDKWFIHTFLWKQFSSTQKELQN